ncbi:16S rRNA (adenine(1518)-N(6)/adenine(1519)-N(6))-dimethyltransferase RsmA [Ruminococcaceae bacterium OttesenSCG-928-O06]|nr:16S rRNA (adenine(1518)-N(6)/adenine(1519)-N(6))-dimethyltransferase RsmA [Ruminococcaceae bacterium OttesenSCG-928-O06]
MQALTSPATIRALCEKHGFSLTKGLGQHFLTNPGVCAKICEAAHLTENSRVLEIGPGFGTLTRQLALRAKQVVALEVDARLLPVLDETLHGLANTTVVQGDVLKTDLAALLTQQFGPGQPVQVCANLPYNITSPVIMTLLEQKLPLASITVMVQQEAARRITAAPGTRQAGAITYAVHYYAQPQYHFSVSPGSFFPPPKVTSGVFSLHLRAAVPLAGQPQREQRLFRLIRAAFGQRRKTLANATAAGLAMEKQQVQTALAAALLPLNARAEQLTLEDYIRLEAALWP